MPPRIFSAKTKSHGNSNKVVTSIPSSWLATERRIYRRTYFKNSINTNIEKDWSKDKTSSGITNKSAAIEIGKSLFLSHNNV
jgi:hypothetical protein